MASPVLLVDSDPAAQRLFQVFFSARGIPLTCASDGYGAITAFARAPAQLVVSEFMPSGGSCKDVHDRVRAHASGSVVPFLVCTAASRIEVETLLPASRLVGYLKKPVDEAELTSVLLDLLGPEALQIKEPPGPTFSPGYPFGAAPSAPAKRFDEEPEYRPDQTVLDLDAEEPPKS